MNGGGTMTIDELITEVARLSDKDQDEFIKQVCKRNPRWCLYELTDDEWQHRMFEIIAARCDDLDSGRVKAVDAFESIARLKKILRDERG